MGFSKRLEERLCAKPHWFVRFGTTIIFLGIVIALCVCMLLNLMDIKKLWPFLFS